MRLKNKQSLCKLSAQINDENQQIIFITKTSLTSKARDKLLRHKLLRKRVKHILTYKC